MILRELRLHAFRAHAETRLTFAPKVNLLVGPNGAGKTNVLEAIHYLCLTKSFIASNDGYVLRQGAPFFEVEGLFEGEQRSHLRVRLVYMPEEGKRVFVNGAPLERLAQVVGMLPVVVFSPLDQAITAGGPEERRRFLDNILSQARPVYLDHLLKYRRALRQRNVLLAEGRRRGVAPAPALLASWDAELVTLGSRVIASRLRFMRAFAGFLEEAYARIESVAERPTITYVTLDGLDPEADEEEVAEVFRARLARLARREQQRGRTLIGPHLDELIFSLNGLEVRRYASQGQHRTFGMALKLAQFFYLKDRLGETPLLLLDDIFDNLDPARTEGFLHLLQSEAIGQSLITAARSGPFDAVVPFEAAGHQMVRVAAGAVCDVVA
ncbi:MAG: DNA replication and repair protein RecF [Rhodothermaceae bacterium]|nr:MAG: DNA replication and repair protein RecF [Rhodothermaceae bacterium]